MNPAPLYFDHASTTPIDQEVWEVMKPYFTEYFGNPSSKSHFYGWQAEAAVDHARNQLAEALKCDEREIIFTSGATESNSLALQGYLEAAMKPDFKPHVITSPTEHRSVLAPLEAFLARGWIELEFVDVDRHGVIDLFDLAQKIRPNTVLVSIQAGNNEVGTLQPLLEIGTLCRAKNILFHVDAAQSLGKIPLDVQTIPIDMMSMSAHKMHGPKGAGALYIRKKRPRIALQAQLLGGDQENGLRSGTLNVPAIVGFGKAVEVAMRVLEAESERQHGLQEHLWNALSHRFPTLIRTGVAGKRLPHILHFLVPKIEATSLFAQMRDLAVSSGSACASHSTDPSHVLLAMGYTDEEAKQAVRFSFGRTTTIEEIDQAVDSFGQAVIEAQKLQFFIETLGEDNLDESAVASSRGFQHSIIGGSPL